MTVLDDLKRESMVAIFLAEALDLVIEDIRQPLEEEEWQQVILEFGRFLCAADGTGRVNRLRGNRFDVESGFGGKSRYRLPRRLLWLGGTTLPAIDCSENNAEGRGELPLCEIKLGAEGSRDIVKFCHYRHMCHCLP